MIDGTSLPMIETYLLTFFSCKSTNPGCLVSLKLKKQERYQARYSVYIL